uniref:UBX domain-containing protein 4 n=1 Tax=Denticeps clupeoides TaxID=299321 RepID=A0AAY4BA04_9TELE
MRWFEGSIPAAIAFAKQHNAIFVVVITGDDEQSGQMTLSWEDDRVAEVTNGSCVAIKVDGKSETCIQFSQIYPVVCIPSSFFIGENGIPLEVIAGSVSAEELTERIHKVLQVRCALLALLTRKLEERREQKKKGEEENDIKKELERRKLGKDMLDFKRKQEDEKTKRLLEERNREKAEEKAARERVKQQIALDRADRAARYAKTQEEVQLAQATALQARQLEMDARRDAAQRERSAVARIQFRLPDGSSFTNQFPSNTPLHEARQFAAQELGNRYGRFSLATMFPRREFVGEDLEKTLLELELAPSASIVVLPQSSRPAQTVVQSSSGGFWAMLHTLLYPLLAFWRFLSGFIFSPQPPSASSSSTAAAAGGTQDTIRKRVLEKRPEDFKRDGKIYRLRTQEDSEDDNNTWNGNSTQQM